MHIYTIQAGTIQAGRHIVIHMQKLKGTVHLLIYEEEEEEGNNFLLKATVQIV